MYRTQIITGLILVLLFGKVTTQTAAAMAPRFCVDKPSASCSVRAGALQRSLNTIVGSPLWRPTTTLTPPEGSTVGYSVALSADGTTIVSGSPSVALDTEGPVSVWTRTWTGWASVPGFLQSDGSAGHDQFGESVAVSADGRVIAVGTPSYSGGGIKRGAVYVYVRPPNGWAAINPFMAILRVSDSTDRDSLGQQVAISADGRTIVAVAASNTDRDAVYVFTAPTGVWASGSENARLGVVRDGLHQLGFTVNMSADASTIIAGGTIGTGASLNWMTYLYQRPATGWVNMLPIAQLTTNDGGHGYHDLAITPDGALIVAGDLLNSAPFYGCGAAYIYTRPPSGWTDTVQTAKLTASDCGGIYEYLGLGVALSNDGTTIALGKPYRDAGLVYLYDRPANGWVNATETTTISPNDGQQYDYFGAALAISPNGGTLVAASWNHAQHGAIYVFGRDRAPAFTSAAPPAATIGTPYFFRFTASGGDAPIFQMRLGTLPPGLTLDPSGVLAGTPTMAGSYSFTVQVSTGVAPDAVQDVTLDIRPIQTYLPLLSHALPLG